MKAVSCLQGALSVVDLPTPQPGTGQLLLDVRRCGICGSDLHARVHADDLDEPHEGGRLRRLHPQRHPHGAGTRILRRGPRARPPGGQGVHTGHGGGVVSAAAGARRRASSPACRRMAPGAYAEQVLAEASLSFAVPNGLDVDTAALTEPMAVALHAVRRSEHRPPRHGGGHRVRPGRPGRHLPPQGHGRRHHRRQRLLTGAGARWPHGAGRTSWSIQRRIRRTTAVGQGRASPRRPRFTNSASARWRSCASCPAGSTCIGSPTSSAPPAPSGR